MSAHNFSECVFGSAIVDQSPIRVSDFSGFRRGVYLWTPGPLDSYSPNLGTVFIGPRGGTTFPLLPGDMIVLPLADLTKVYAIAGADSQRILWMGS